MHSPFYDQDIKKILMFTVIETLSAVKQKKEYQKKKGKTNPFFLFFQSYSFSQTKWRTSNVNYRIMKSMENLFEKNKSDKILLKNLIKSY